MPQSMVHIENLVKRYGDLTALNHLELDIREGEIFGLLGPNGSGKTTAISCLLSLLKYDRGEIKIFGEEMKPDSYKLKEQIGIVLQNVAVFDELTVQEISIISAAFTYGTGNGEKSWWRMPLNLQVLKISAKCTRRSFPGAFYED